MHAPPRAFLFVVWEGGGNLPPILGLAQRLVERGHAVRVISDPCNQQEVLSAGATFVPYTRAPHRHDKQAASTIVNDYVAKNAASGFRIWLDTVACGPALAYAQDVLAELARHPADVLVVNELLFGGLFAAEQAGLPCAMVIPGTYNLPAPGMPPIGSMPMAGLGGWLRDRLARFIVERLLGTGMPALQQARHQLGLPPLDNPVAYVEQLDRVLVLTSPAFEFAATFPANVRLVGPILDDPAWPTGASPSRARRRLISASIASSDTPSAASGQTAATRTPASRRRNMAPVVCNLLYSEHGVVWESMARRSYTFQSHRRDMASWYAMRGWTTHRVGMFPVWRCVMAKAIQCDMCGQVIAQNRATGWRTLTLQSRGFITGDGTSGEFDPRADVCSVACARQWFDKVAPTCFHQAESEPPHAERSVGHAVA